MSENSKFHKELKKRSKNLDMLCIHAQIAKSVSTPGIIETAITKKNN